MTKIVITTEQELSTEDISDLLVTAFEGGINYWCGPVEIVYENDGSEVILGVPKELQSKVIYASDAIALGGSLLLHDIEEEDEDADDPNYKEKWTLTKDKLIAGILKEMKYSDFASIEKLMDNHDADNADRIIQFALFGEIVYG